MIYWVEINRISSNPYQKGLGRGIKKRVRTTIMKIPFSKFEMGSFL